MGRGKSASRKRTIIPLKQPSGIDLRRAGDLQDPRAVPTSAPSTGVTGRAESGYAPDPTVAPRMRRARRRALTPPTLYFFGGTCARSPSAAVAAAMQAIQRVLRGRPPSYLLPGAGARGRDVLIGLRGCLL